MPSHWDCIVAGSRSATRAAVFNAMKLCPFAEKITRVVSGTARGADTFGEEWARWRGLPVNRFPADWRKHGRIAGFLRNAEMAEVAQGLVAVWDGESRGTANMIELARNRGLEVYVYRFEKSAVSPPLARKGL